MSLGTFAGRPVIRSAISITKASDGLSEALTVEPQEWDHDEEVYFVLKGTVAKVVFEHAGKELDELVRKHVIATDEITVVNAIDVEGMLAAAKARVERAKQERTGQIPLQTPDGDTPDGFESPAEQVLVMHHRAGRHRDDLVDACPLCEDERAAEREEAGVGV